MNSDVTGQQLAELVGHVIHSVRRMFYVHDGEADRSDGPVELMLDSGAVQFEPGDNAEELRVIRGPWEDPFAEPLSPENAEFVATSGKWTAFDVSSEPGYAPLIGARINGIDPITNVDDQIVGVALRTSNGRTLKAEVKADDLVVDVI
jgi:hypothetical protein